MDELFAVTHDAPEANNVLGGTWAKQAYAFVHWGLYGDQGKHQKAFITFLRRLDREPATEALFKECFKQSYKDMLFTIRGYVEFTNYKIAGVQAGKGEKLPTPSVRAARGHRGRGRSDQGRRVALGRPRRGRAHGDDDALHPRRT